MKDEIFEGSKYSTGCKINICVAKEPQIPYISFENNMGYRGMVYFHAKEEWERFKRAIRQADFEAVFEEEVNTEAQALREHAEWCIEKAKELEEDC